MGGGIDPRTPLGSLSPGQKQRVEIARALSLNAKVLLLDEPTATLTETDAAMLFDLLRELRKQGLAMVYISHRLAEVLEITDRIVCLRDGQKVAEVLDEGDDPRRTWSSSSPARAASTRPTSRRRPRSSRRCVLEVRGRVTFDLHAGEILGLAGLVGAGRTSVLTGLFGGRPGRQPDNLQVKVRGPGGRARLARGGDPRRPRAGPRGARVAGADPGHAGRAQHRAAEAAASSCSRTRTRSRRRT